MNIYWITQKDFANDLDIATWLEIAKSLGKRDNKITIISAQISGKKFKQRIKNVEIHPLKVLNHFPLLSVSFNIKIMMLCFYWTLRKKPDFILAHPFTSIFLLPAIIFVKRLRLKTKFILDIRTLPILSRGISGKIKENIIHFSIRLGLRYFNGITVITPALRNILAKRYHLKPDLIGIWMSGVNAGIFKPSDKNKPVNKDEKSTKFRIMYHGVFAENRGIVETIHAMNFVKDLNPDIIFFILGKGPGEVKIKETIKELELDSYVKLHEPVPHRDIPQYIEQADIGIVPLPDLPCWQVSSPLKLFEYFSMGKPTIVSPIEAHTSIVNNCNAALFLKSTSPKDICSAIMCAYYNRKLLNDWGREGRELICDEFTWEQQSLKLEKFLHKLF